VYVYASWNPREQVSYDACANTLGVSRHNVHTGRRKRPMPVGEWLQHGRTSVRVSCRGVQHYRRAASRLVPCGAWRNGRAASHAIPRGVPHDRRRDRCDTVLSLLRSLFSLRPSWCLLSTPEPPPEIRPVRAVALLVRARRHVQHRHLPATPPELVRHARDTLFLLA